MKGAFKNRVLSRVQFVLILSRGNGVSEHVWTHFGVGAFSDCFCLTHFGALESRPHHHKHGPLCLSFIDYCLGCLILVGDLSNSDLRNNDLNKYTHVRNIPFSILLLLRCCRFSVVSSGFSNATRRHCMASFTATSQIHMSKIDDRETPTNEN